ncbi:hypothetical protein HY212_04800 [Candidatus Pacearchaeota archaeon]|nr:hypothetical protein [Candidatus Pacearchaeota archaeon]
MGLTDKLTETRKAIKTIVNGTIMVMATLGVNTYLIHAEHQLRQTMPQSYKSVREIFKEILNLNYLKIETGEGALDIYTASKINCDSVSRRLEKTRVLESKKDSLMREEDYKTYDEKYNMLINTQFVGNFVLAPMLFIGVGKINSGRKKLKDAKK